MQQVLDREWLQILNIENGAQITPNYYLFFVNLIYGTMIMIDYHNHNVTSSWLI